MNLIQSLKEKSEADRLRFEAELPVLAERVAHSEATEAEVAKWTKASGISLDRLQAAVDRQLEIDRLKALVDQYRQRSLEAYRHNLETAKHRAFVMKTQRDLESEANRLRSVGWQLGIQANESREAFAKLGEITGVLHPVPKLEAEYRAMDTEFAVVVAEPVVSQAELPSD